MSVAERKAYDVYNRCNIGALAPDVKRQLMILILSNDKFEDVFREEPAIDVAGRQYADMFTADKISCSLQETEEGYANGTLTGTDIDVIEKKYL